MPLSIVVLFAVAALTVAGTANAALTKEELRQRSGEICASAHSAADPHVRRAEHAADRDRVNAFVRHTRRALRVVKRHVRRLSELRAPSSGRARYRTFVDNTRQAVRWLDLMIDALVAGREGLLFERARKAERHARRAERAARRYPLKRPCIKLTQ